MDACADEDSGPKLPRPRWDVEEAGSLGRVRARMFGRVAEPVSLSRYVVLRPVASGGFGAVYEAYDPELDRKVAVKLLQTPAAETAEVEEAVTRLLREARALARLTHPAVLPVYDVGRYMPPDASAPTAVFMVTELVEGTTLRAWLAQRRRAWADVLRLFVSAGRGLAAAHAAGLVHRDFKPANVLLGDDGRVRVADFGLVRWSRGDEEQGAGPPSVRTDPDAAAVELTQAGTVMGTPRYMAPEQHAGGLIDARTDQYSFCVALYEAVYGEPPFAGTSLESLATAKAVGPPAKPPPGSRAPARLHRLLRRGLETDPDHRFASLEELLEALTAIGRRRRLGAMGLAAGLVVASGIVVLQAGNAEHLCSDVETLDAHWNAQRARHLTQRLEARAGATTARNVQAAIDAYVQQWQSARRDTCRTALSTDPSAAATRRRLACFEQRRRALDAIIDVLRSADDRTARRAEAIVEVLPEVSGCTNDEALALDFIPVERDEADVVARAMARIISLRALRLAGRYEEARAEAREAQRLADASGHDPTRSRALFALAWAESGLLELGDAEQHVRAGWHVAEANGLGELAVRGVIDLADNLRVQERFEEALHTMDLADAKARFYAVKPGRESDLAYQRAMLLAAVQRYDESVEWFEQTLRMRSELFGPDHVALGWTRSQYGRVLAERGDLDAARAQLDEALRIYAAQPDAEPVASAPTRVEVANVDHLSGRHEAALQTLQATCLELQNAGASYRLDLVRCRICAGEAALAVGRADTAVAAFDAARELATELLAPGRPSVVRAETGLAAARALNAEG